MTDQTAQQPAQECVECVGAGRALGITCQGCAGTGSVRPLRRSTCVPHPST